MGRKTFLLPLLFLFILASSNVVYSVKGQVDSLNFRFEAQAVGECVVGYGELGPSGPLPLEWACLGNGQARINGYAADAVCVLVPPFLSLYFSQDVKAVGTVNVGWTGKDGSKHRLVAVIYSTETSEGVFIPSEDRFCLTVTTPPHFSPEKALRFKGVYISSKGVEAISGGALFGASIYGPPPFPDYITVFLGLEESGEWHAMFYLVWSLTQTEIGLGQNYLDPPFITLSAAKVYKSIVKQL